MNGNSGSRSQGKPKRLTRVKDVGEWKIGIFCFGGCQYTFGQQTGVEEEGLVEPRANLGRR